MKSLESLMNELQKKQSLYAIDDLTARELGTKAHAHIVDKSDLANMYMKLQNSKPRAQAFIFVTTLVNEHDEKGASISPYVCFEQLMQFGIVARGRSTEENKKHFYASFEDFMINDKTKIAPKECADIVWKLIEPLVKEQEVVEVATLDRYLIELNEAINKGVVKKREGIEASV